MDKSPASFDPATATVSLAQCDGAGDVLLKTKKLASKCCMNVSKQQLSQNDIAIVCPIDFDPGLSHA